MVEREKGGATQTETIFTASSLGGASTEKHRARTKAEQEKPSGWIFPLTSVRGDVEVFQLRRKLTSHPGVKTHDVNMAAG